MYDVDIESRLQAVVDQIVTEHETVEFLIYPLDTFYYLCLSAVLRAKMCYPHKVTITLVVQHNSYFARVPACMIDQTVTLRFATVKTNDISISHNRRLKWLVQKSTHLVRYIYERLYDADCHLPKRSDALEIIGLENPETENAIEKATSLLSEKEQIIYQRMNEGCTMKEAGRALGVGQEWARQQLQHGCRRIRKQLHQRYHRMLGIGARKKKRTCGLFVLGEATRESLERFKKILEFLVSTYNVRDIYIEHSYIKSDFAVVVSDPHLALHITAVMSGKLLADVEKLLCSPCHTVSVVSYTDIGHLPEGFDVISDILEQTDFCLCDLSATPHMEEIRRCAAQTKKAVLLDMSRTNSGDNRT